MKLFSQNSRQQTSVGKFKTLGELGENGCPQMLTQ